MSFAFVKGEAGGKFDLLFKFEAANKKYKVRMLTDDCISMLVHTVQSVIEMDDDNKQKTLRPYRTYLCRFENQSSCQTGLCDIPDPMWEKLPTEDRFAKDDKNAPDEDKPIHFRRTSQHIIPIYNYESERVELLRQGNKLFEQLANIAETRGTLRAFDVVMWKEGKGKFGTTYHATTLQDSQFDTDDTIKSQYEDLMAWVGTDMFAFNYDEMTNFINGRDVAPAGRRIDSATTTTKSLAAPPVEAQEVKQSTAKKSTVKKAAPAAAPTKEKAQATDSGNNKLIYEILGMSSKYSDVLTDDDLIAIIKEVMNTDNIDLRLASAIQLNTIISKISDKVSTPVED